MSARTENGSKAPHADLVSLQSTMTLRSVKELGRSIVANLSKQRSETITLLPRPSSL
jgi:hypothetical protein